MVLLEDSGGCPKAQAQLAEETIHNFFVASAYRLIMIPSAYESFTKKKWNSKYELSILVKYYLVQDGNPRTKIWLLYDV